MTFIQIDAVTSDRLLIALFGGCLIGVDFASEVDLCRWNRNPCLLTPPKIGLNVSEVFWHQ
jgi:hypothetical protein